jgi:hypothetical protein
MSDTDTAGKSRDLSTISFPYADLDDAIVVARGLLEGGGVPMSRDQLAATVGAAPGSGSFNVKLGSARIFGLMETVQGKYQLTALGHEIIDNSRTKSAKVQAFLNVPLYKRAFDEFRNKQLPPRPHGLEQAFVSFGVAPKQKDKARQIFDRSARSAGFFPRGDEDRLVQPVIGTLLTSGGEPIQMSLQPRDPMESAGDVVERVRRELAPGPAVSPQGLDGVIVALIEKLPRKGSAFPDKERTKWLAMMEMALGMAYPDEENVS